MPSGISVLAGFAVAVGIAGISDPGLTGKWRAETHFAGTTALMTLQFFPNGTYARRVVSTTEYGWTLEGNTLLLAPAISSTAGKETVYGKASTVMLSFSGDSLIASSGGQSLPLHRVTWPVKDSPLLGRWQGSSDLNEGITQDFTADGKLIVNLTLSTEAGRYRADRGSIMWEEQIPIPGRSKSKYKLENGKLTLFFSSRLPPIELTRIVADTLP